MPLTNGVLPTDQDNLKEEFTLGKTEPKISTVLDTHAAPDSQENATQTTNVTGRSVFAIETTAAGVVVRTAFLTEENRLLDMPAVFPDIVYAMNVIDDLKRQVMQHFSQAAQIGAQVIASQAQQKEPVPSDQATDSTQS